MSGDDLPEYVVSECIRCGTRRSYVPTVPREDMHYNSIVGHAVGERVGFRTCYHCAKETEQRRVE